jgi:hypothetical protein
MKRFLDTSVIGPTGMDTLQQCFEDVLARSGHPRDSRVAEKIAHSLIAAYQGGLRSPEDLVQAADAAAQNAGQSAER